MPTPKIPSSYLQRSQTGAVRTILRRQSRAAAALVCALILTGCTESGSGGANLLTGLDLTPRSGRSGQSGHQITGGDKTTFVYLDANEDEIAATPGVTPTDEGYAVNLQAVPVADAARSILGDVLKHPYSLDPKATGTITMATGRPVPREQLLMIFEEALAANGLVLLEGGGQFVIRSDDGNQRPGGIGVAGYGLTAVPLQNVDAEKMLTLLDGFVADSGNLRASARDDVILVRGTARERASLADIIRSLDVELMARRDAGIAFLKNSSATAVSLSLEELQAKDGAAKGWKFQVLEQANAILVVARGRDDLRAALEWIEQFDRAGGAASAQVHVYNVQFARASKLAAILENTLGGGQASSIEVPADTADMLSSQPSADAAPQGDGLAFPADMANGRPTMLSLSTAAGEGDVRFIANDADNTIVIRAPEAVRRDALALLAELDRTPVQVLIEVMLVEVSLNDATRFGVQAYLNGADGGLLSGAADGSGIATQSPGFNMILSATSSPRLIIDALEQVTSTRVVSAPSVIAFENEEAEIKIVDQVPITTQKMVGTQSADAPVINTIEYRDAGVILRVTPQVSETDLVNLMVKQELSAVLAEPAGETTLTPRLRQRSISTQVSVYDQQTVTLGGLISTQSSKDRKGAPLIGILGGGRKAGSDSRTELLIFITPHVVRNQRDAAAVSEELRSKMTAMSDQ